MGNRRWFAGQQQALIDELLAALHGLVEFGTDSPEHQAAEAAIRKAQEWMDTG